MQPIVALYARVSTPQQEREATIESQVAAIEAFAAEQGYLLKPEFYFLDRAVSGAQLVRPALDRLRDLAAESAFSKVLCLSFDRLSRNYAHQWLLLDELQRVGVRVVIIDQLDLGDDPQAQLFLGMQGLFAEYERAVIAERLRRGKLYRIRQGQLVSPNAPYGYRYVPVSQPNGGRWAVVECEAAVVRQIYQWYTAAGLKIWQIVDRLDAQGAAAPPRGKQWRYSTVQAILTQPAYTGQAYYNRTRTCHEVVGRAKKQGRGYLQRPQHLPRPKAEWIAVSVPALLPVTVWEQAQEQLEMNQKFASRNQHHFYLLRSLLVCNTCGRTLAGRTSDGKVTYSCTNRGKHRSPDVPQHSCSVKGAVIEPLVWQAVVDLLRNPTFLADAWLHEQASADAAPGELERLEAQQRALERQWTRLLDLYQDGLVEKATLSQRKARLDAAQQQLSSRLQALQQQRRRQQAKDEMLADFETFCQEMLARLDNPTAETQQEVIRLLIDHIVVKDNEIVIKHIIPTDDDCRLLPGRREARRMRRGARRRKMFSVRPEFFAI
jgi:site-specific DNA recombinase